ncbi:MAG: sugar phosphate isomerase/epimerase [Verrucomicrobia bacterium]|nr:sugar phosphate isomerase/epimerase [Verrucomicrobiota bacterium]
MIQQPLHPASGPGTTRRHFLKHAAAAAATTYLVSATSRAAENAPTAATQSKGMKIGFHTDAFNSSYWSFEKCLEWAKKNDVHFIECGLIDGVSWIHGLGYQPHVALYEDPVMLRRKMEKYGVQFSQVDAAFPLSGEDGPLRGVPYVMKSIAWAAQAGAPCVDTTDGLHKPEGLSDAEAMAMMKRSYQQIIRVAEAHQIIVNIEPHGYFTTNPDAMAEMQAFCDSPHLRMNLDTGNTFIAGRDPVAFLKRFLPKVSHVHVKDVSESLARAVRGGQTGIAVSHCSLGAGVNAANIRECLKLLRDNGYHGMLSMECEGQGGPMIEQSLAWLRGTLKELEIEEAKQR